jgi:hypothetical protein
MKRNDRALIQAARHARKFFPEAKSFEFADVGLDWDTFLGAMMVANYAADYSCDPFRNPSDPDLGLAAKGGLDGNDGEIYIRLLSHSGIRPSGRAVVIPNTIEASGLSAQDCLPFVCASQEVAGRLDEMECFGRSLETIIVFESGEALLVDHDDRVHWARSKVNRQWEEHREQTNVLEPTARSDSIRESSPPAGNACRSARTTLEQYYCPCCGFLGLKAPAYVDLGSPPWRFPGPPPYEQWFGMPSYEVCPCCGFEFGNDDNPGTAQPSSFEEYRASWMAEGCPWFDSTRRPKEWAPTEQLAAVKPIK